MTPRRAWLWALVAILLAAIGLGSGWVLWRDYLFEVEDFQIPGGVPVLSAGEPQRLIVPTDAPPYALHVAANGRNFVDQSGNPILIRGDSPWALLSRLSLSQIETYWSQRQQQGFNAAIMLFVGSREGSGSWDGSTPDGIRPFQNDYLFFNGDVTRLNPAYLQRTRDAIKSAAQHGITVFLYAADTWSMGRTFRPSSQQACADYGRALAAGVADLPNIVWVLGGDFTLHDSPTSVDRCFDAVRLGIRAAGDRRPISIQFTSPMTYSTLSTFWASRVDWNFLYSYAPPYQGARSAFRSDPPKPVILGETNYEGMNLQPGTPTTTLASLRRQVAWALTSGASGDFWGNDDWQFPPGWEARTWPGYQQVNSVRDVVGALPWWQMHPAGDREVVIDDRPPSTDLGRDVLDDDRVTAATDAEHTVALVYFPASVTVKVVAPFDRSGVRFVWVDPSNGSRRSTPPSANATPPGKNAAGDEDWLLEITRR